MRRALLICLSLILALVGWSAVGADDGFYVIPAMKGQYAPVPKTGQTVSYATGDDGDWHLKKGVAWPTPRFTDHGNGTVTDNLTGLIWMQNANAFGTQTWSDALTTANTLASGSGGLSDGSQAGDWRLPNLRELQSLIDYGSYNPALPALHPFANVQTSVGYWSSTAAASPTTSAWGVAFVDGRDGRGTQSYHEFVWCVRGGN